MRAVLLGGTRGMGRALARELAGRGARLFLLGRDEAALAESARDLELRGAVGPVGFARCDLADPAGFGAALDRADAALDGFDAALLTAAAFDVQERLEQDTERTARLLETNTVGTILFCEEARRRLLARGGGLLCAFGSVAGERPRKPVVLYGATKAALAYYLRGCELRYGARGLRVLLVLPGFIRTGMTQGLPEPPFAGDPEDVARRVVRAIDSGRSRVYAPGPWRWIMLVLRMLPDAVMRRVEF